MPNRSHLRGLAAEAAARGALSAAGFTIIDGNTIEFQLPALAAGAHTLTMLEGALEPLDPVDALAAFHASIADCTRTKTCRAYPGSRSSTWR